MGRLRDIPRYIVKAYYEIVGKRDPRSEPRIIEEIRLERKVFHSYINDTSSKQEKSKDNPLYFTQKYQGHFKLETRFYGHDCSDSRNTADVEFPMIYRCQ